MRFSILMMFLSGCAPAMPMTPARPFTKVAPLAEISSGGAGLVLIDWASPPPDAAHTCVRTVYEGKREVMAHLEAKGLRVPVSIKPGIGKTCYSLQPVGNSLRLLLDEELSAHLRAELELENVGQ